MHRTVLSAIVSCCALVALAAFAAPAFAGWPGENGRIVFVQNVALGGDLGSKLQVHTMLPDGTDVTRVGFSTVFEGTPTYSADGQKIAFSRGDFGDENIWVMDADGSNELQLTTGDGASNSSPSWSPDGTKIAFRSARDGNAELYVMDADGTDVVRVTTTPLVSEDLPVFTPDGANLIYQQFVDNTTGQDLFIRPADGSGTATAISAGSDNETTVDISPDGTMIAFSCGQRALVQNHVDICVSEIDGENRSTILGTGFSEAYPGWSPDGTRIVFHSTNRPQVGIYSMDPDGGDVQLMLEDLNSGEADWQSIAPPPPDTDGDGLSDPDDLCPAQSDTGKHRTPRTGCPAEAPVTGGGSNPPPPVVVTPADTTAPAAKVNLGGGPAVAGANGSVSLATFTCSEPAGSSCAVAVAVTARLQTSLLKPAKKAKKPPKFTTVNLGKANLAVAGGASAPIKVTLSKANRALLGRLKTLKTTVKITVKDAAGNPTVITRTVVIKAPKPKKPAKR